MTRSSQGPVTGAARPDPAEPLIRNRNFTLLWVGGSLSALGSRASSIAFPLLVLAVGGSPAAAGVVGAAAMAPHLLFQLVAGTLVDRWNRRTVMVLTDVGRALALGSVAWAALAGEPAPPHLGVVAFVEGTLTVFHQLAQRGAVRTVVPDHHLGAAVARTEVTLRAAFLGGQPLGGLLFALGRWVPFLADMASYLVSLVTVLLLRGRFRESAQESGQESGPEATRVLAQLREGFGWLWRQPFLRAVAAAISASNLLVNAMTLAVIVTLTERGASSVQVGLVLGGAGVGGVAGALLAPWLAARWRLGTLVIGTYWLWAALILVVAVFDRAPVMAAGFALFAFGGAVVNVAGGAYQLRITPPRLMGRVSGVIGTVSVGAVPIGSLLGGVLLARYGGTTTLGVISALMIVTAIAVTLTPAVRRDRGARQFGETTDLRPFGAAQQAGADPAAATTT